MNRIHLRISEKILTVRNENGAEIARFPIIAGRNSHLGHKQKEGDERTPRGEYYICTRNDRSIFTLFFGISYPSPADGRQALLEGIIGESRFDEIIKAHEQNLRPPWNTAMGGEVGIHGGGTDRDGTRGCIGMQDTHIMELDRLITLGCPVTIEY